jgi:endonuclease YncB( thermonuclease family)
MCAAKEKALFTLAGRRMAATVIDVYDGDTCTVEFVHADDDPVFRPGAVTQWSCRLMGIDTPELRPRRNIRDRDVVIRKARAARDALRDLVLGKPVTVECGPFDKYGRVLGTLFVEGHGTSINAQLLEQGHASQYLR